MDYLSDILIIDDNIEEAYNLADLFAKNNCNSTILKPDDVNDTLNLFPKIICCDIGLYSIDLLANCKQIVSLLKKIFAKNKGAYILIAWTSHKDELKTLKKQIRLDQDVNKPIYTCALGKEDFRDEPQKLKTRLKRILYSRKGLRTLLVWNSIIKEANDKTLNKIFELSKETETELLDLLFGLADANIGKDNIDYNEIVSLIKPIDYILRDNIDKELIQRGTKKILKNIFKNIDKTEKKVFAENIKIKINSMLHINMNIDHENIIPGDVIKYSQEELQKLFKISNYPENFFEYLTIDKKADDIIWGLLEVTPDCDFSHNKIHNINKFVPIYLIPKNKLSKKFKTVDWFKHTNLEIEYNKKHYVFAADCRFIFSMKSEELYRDKMFSLRENLFTSYRQYVYSYNSRIGTISF